MLQLHKCIISQDLSKIFNENIEKANFPIDFKFANTIPLHKKENQHDIVNNRPASILPILSEFLKWCLYNQIYKTVDSISSKYQTGYWKGYSSQHSLISFFEKWRKHLDKKGGNVVCYS